jgi:putative FmdB family regulatory protein
MPTYDYFCPGCRHFFSARHKIAEPRPYCPQCSGVVEPAFLTAPAVHGAGARGREAAIRSLTAAAADSGHGPKCPCCH